MKGLIQGKIKTLLQKGMPVSTSPLSQAARFTPLLAVGNKEDTDRQAGNLRFPQHATKYYQTFEKS